MVGQTVRGGAAGHAERRSAGPPPASTDSAANLLRQRVLAAAKQCVIATNKYDYRTIDADEAAGLKCTTGVQSTRYKTAMENLIQRPGDRRSRPPRSAQINTAGIESVTANGRQWSIVVYGQLAIHNVNVKARTDPFAAVVRMDYVAGKWLMSDVDDPGRDRPASSDRPRRDAGPGAETLDVGALGEAPFPRARSSTGRRRWACLSCPEALLFFFALPSFPLRPSNGLLSCARPSATSRSRRVGG